MYTIRKKIYFVIAMLVAAIAIGVAICAEDEHFFAYKPLAYNTVVVTDTLSRQRGKKLFNENCTACHSFDKIVDGPSLKGVGQRLPDTVIKELLIYPEKTIKSNDYLRNLFNQYHAAHPTF